MDDRLNMLAQRLERSFPGLRAELADAGMHEGPVEYLSKAMKMASIAALCAFSLSALLFMINRRPFPSTSVAICILAFVLVLFAYVKKPSQIMRMRASRIERSLVFSLHAINIEMSSGIKFPQALEDVASRDYGEFSHEMRMVLDDAHKHGLRSALERSGRRNPSKVYRRFVWQVVNSLDTGANMQSNIRSIVEDLRRTQEDDAHRYGKTMEKQLTVYVMGGIVFPALAAVILQTTSMFGALKGISGERPFWAIFTVSVIIQTIFFYMIKFKKPSLLGESLIREDRGDMIGNFKSLLGYAGVKTEWRHYIVSKAILSLVCGMALSLVLKQYTPFDYPQLIMLSSVFSAVTIYTSLVYAAEQRGEKTAEYLPDSLRMMAANMDAGIAIDQALFMSARQEFGVLGKEVKLMAGDMMKNHTFEEALDGLRRRVKSEPLHMSVNLVSHGLRAGRGLSSALYHIADILQEREYTRRSVATQLSAIRTMVLILVVLSAPILYATAMVAGSVMTQFNDKLKDSMPPEVAGQGWLRPSGGSVSPEFLDGYFMTSLFATSLLGSVIIGEVTSGKTMDGLRYMLFIALTSEALYVILKMAMMERIGGFLA